MNMPSRIHRDGTYFSRMTQPKQAHQSTSPHIQTPHPKLNPPHTTEEGKDGGEKTSNANHQAKTEEPPFNARSTGNKLTAPRLPIDHRSPTSHASKHIHPHAARQNAAKTPYPRFRQIGLQPLHNNTNHHSAASNPPCPRLIPLYIISGAWRPWQTQSAAAMSCHLLLALDVSAGLGLAAWTGRERSDR